MTEPDSVITFVAVGSNIDPERNIIAALELLARQVRLLDCSTFYRTKPVGAKDQPDYCNGVIKLETSMTAREFKFELLRGIESELGRERNGNKYAPRVIDLDIILYGDCVIEEEGLVIPDRDLRERAFVAAPLFELEPALVLPDTQRPLADLPLVHNTEELEPDRPFSRLIRERFFHEC